MTLLRAAFYGSLRQAIYDPQAPRIDDLARVVGTCTLRGRLVDHGTYPGFFEPEEGEDEAGLVHADLLDILDPVGFFTIFDAWEDYIPGAPERSLYVRAALPLHAPGGEAWVYVSNQAEGDTPVPHGDWCRHVRETRGRM